MSNRFFSFPQPVPIALPLAMGLWFASLAITPGCHPPSPPSAVSPSTRGVAPEDRILALQSREFLAHRE
jgi:hypothetical protein